MMRFRFYIAFLAVSDKHPVSSRVHQRRIALLADSVFYFSDSRRMIRVFN